MDFAEVILLIVNLLIGISCAIPISRLICRVNRTSKKVYRYFFMLIAIYFLESAAITAGTLVPVFAIGLAFVWGIVFGLWFRRISQKNEAVRTSFFIALYSSLPTASFIIVPVIVWLKGWPVLSVEEAMRFGIPDFVPWPLNTILGFFGFIAIGAFVVKTLITTGEVSLIIHYKESSRAHDATADNSGSKAS